jgi:hypothetical protein
LHLIDADFRGRRGGRLHGRSSRFTTNFRVPNKPNSDNVKPVKDERLDKLCSMVVKANTTSALNTLEEYRKSLSKTAFRSLILSLTTKFNDATWRENFQLQNSSRTHFQVNPPSTSDVNHCILIILYYIVSVINKYQINSVDSIWTEILDNSQTTTMTVRNTSSNRIK